MGKITIYTYAKCSTCRDAVKWLRAQGIDFVEKPIRETPPAPAELRLMLARLGGSPAFKKLFNTSGIDYRAQNLAARLPALTESQGIELLASNGNLVKRPFVLGPGSSPDGIGLVGFDEARWSAALLA